MTDEYTPTTYDIRTNYGTARNPNGTTEQQFKQRTAEFDRWLEAHDEEISWQYCRAGCEHDGKCTFRKGHDGPHSASGYCVWSDDE